MGQRIRRWGMTLLTAVVLFFLCGMISGAEELKLYQLGERTDIKEQMDDNSRTLVSLEAGTPVLFLDETRGWMKIRYQDYEGYVRTGASITNVVSAEEMEEEFQTVQKEFDSVYEGISIRQREEKQSILWKIIIFILVVLIIGSYAALGIMKQTEKRKGRNHKEEKESEDLCQK